MRNDKSMVDHWKEGLKRCRENLKSTKDPMKRDIIQRQIAQYKHFIKVGVLQGDNSLYAPVQDDDTVQFSTGQGSNW
jgi:hypothetical protein